MKGRTVPEDISSNSSLRITLICVTDGAESFLPFTLGSDSSVQYRKTLVSNHTTCMPLIQYSYT